MIGRSRMVWIGMAVACAGCANPPAPTTPAAPPGSSAPAVGSLANPGLAGTRWRLVAVQSKDVSGTARPAPDRLHVIEFRADGGLAAQLDCNRGTASWQEGIAHATGGSLRIGPVASTRALCPPPSMGELLAARLSDVASYRLRDGHLVLVLKADGGSLEFRPN